MEQQVHGTILVVDDEKSMRELLSIMLSGEGYQVDTAPNAESALEKMELADYDLVIADLKMPGMGGIALLKKIKERWPKLLVIVITAHASLGFEPPFTGDTAVEAMRLGAYNYLKKPFDNDAIKEMVSRALMQKDLYASFPQNARDEVFSISSIIGNHPKMKRIYDLITRVAPTDSTVLIRGESGTGKELVARAIHYGSLRAQETFIAVNCGAFTETLLESELFGHVKGSFTGALADKKGLVEVAHKGSLFLDEVAEMSPRTQVKFLRILENQEFKPVGGLATTRVDLRIIAATNQNLEQMIESGLFREDLYYRLNVISFELPPLRERSDDIPMLAGHFLAMYSKRMGKNIIGFDDNVLDALASYEWPGNVRELENVIQRAVALVRGEKIKIEDLPNEVTHGSPKILAGSKSDGIEQFMQTFDTEGNSSLIVNIEEHLEQVEKHYINKALDMARGNITQAAEFLGMSFRSMRYKIKKYKIHPKK